MKRISCPFLIEHKVGDDMVVTNEAMLLNMTQSFDRTYFKSLKDPN